MKLQQAEAANLTSVVNVVLKRGCATHNWLLSCVQVSPTFCPFPFSLSSSFAIPTLPPPLFLALPLQYSLYPITASLLLWSSFSCRHNENWQDTLLSTALLPPSLFLPPSLPPSLPLSSLLLSKMNTFFHHTIFSLLLWVDFPFSCSNLAFFLC